MMLPPSCATSPPSAEQLLVAVAAIALFGVVCLCIIWLISPRN